MSTRAKRIYALGDCITINQQASRFIEPISRQAKTMAAAIAGEVQVPYEISSATVRIKTASMPLTQY